MAHTYQQIAADFRALQNSNARTPTARWIEEDLADMRLVMYASGLMQQKLQHARDKGRAGWWRPKECTIEYLRRLLAEHVDKGDPVDIMTLAAMIAIRERADGEVTT